MWRRVKENFDSGIEKVKWFTSLLNDRIRIEISLMHLLYKSNEIEKERAALLKTIGERFFELRKKPDRHIRQDPVIVETLENLEKLDAEIENLKKKADDLGRLEE
jgi:hypothetical protein